MKQELEKETSKFNSAISKLNAIFEGKFESNVKLDKTGLIEIRNKLLNKRKQDLAQEISDGFEKLIEAKRTYNNEIKKLESDLEKQKIAKMKEFNEAVNKLFNKVEGIKEIEEEYLSVIGEVKNIVDNKE